MSPSLYTHDTKHLELLVTRLRRTAQKRGREELPIAQGQGQQPRAPGCDGARAAERSYPTSTERRLRGRRSAERSYSTFKVRRGSREETLLIQGKEQWLHFAGAAVKRYPTSKVRQSQVRR